MSETYMNPAVCDEKMNRHHERFVRDKERIDKHDVMIENLNDASIKLTQLIAIHSEDLKEQAARITQIEHRPGKLWDKVVGGLISAVVGGLAAALVAAIVA